MASPPTGTVAHLFTAIAGRNLTQAEWDRYLPDVPYEVTCRQWPAGK